MNNCNCQRDCLLPLPSQGLDSPNCCCSIFFHLDFRPVGRTLWLNGVGEPGHKEMEKKCLLLLVLARIHRSEGRVFRSQLCVHNLMHFLSRLHLTPSSCISLVFTVSVLRIYRSQGLGRTSSVWYSSTTLCSHNQTQPYK